MFECTIHTRTQIKSVASLLACKIYYDSTAEVSIQAYSFFPCHCCFSWFIIICVFFQSKRTSCCPPMLSQSRSLHPFPTTECSCLKTRRICPIKKTPIEGKDAVVANLQQVSLSARQWHSVFLRICNLVGVTNSSPLKLGLAQKETSLPSSKHLFSGAILVSGRVDFDCISKIAMLERRCLLQINMSDIKNYWKHNSTYLNILI